MIVRVKLKEHSEDVLNLLEQNVPKALTAAGIKAVNLILWQMRQGFGRPIRKSGDLQRDVNYKVRGADHAVDIGNSLEYSTFVHEGTRRMPARPYITRALTGDDHEDQLSKAIAEALKTGFE